MKLSTKKRLESYSNISDNVMDARVKIHQMLMGKGKLSPQEIVLFNSVDDILFHLMVDAADEAIEVIEKKRYG